MHSRSPFATRTVSALAITAVLALLAGGGCGGDTTGPTGGAPVAISVGDTIAGTVSQRDTQRVYSVHPASGYYAVFLQTLSGNVVLTVDNPGSLGVLGTAISFPNRPLLDNATQIFLGQGDVEIRVTWDHAASQASFRFVMLPVNTAPENHAATLTLGDTVNDETLATVADVDEFTFVGKAGQAVVAMIQALGAPGTGTIEVEILDGPGGTRLGLAQSAGGDTSLELHTTGVISLPADRSYTARVHSLPAHNVADPNYAGPYRLAVMAIDSAAELASPVVASWDTVADAISPIGDVDVFTFSGTAGQEFNLFLQARSGSATDLIHATIPALATTYSVGSDSSLLRQHTGRFALPATGTYKILVYGESDQVGGDRGPYRFALYPINRKPENSPDTIALGDSVLGERIDFPGDVDEYHVVVPESTGVTLLAQLGADGVNGMVQASLLDTAGRTITGVTSDSIGKYSQNSAVVGPGTYVVRVEGFDRELAAPGSFAGGHYRLWLFPFGVGPELTKDTIAIGDTITGENLYPLGDVDRYVFFGTKGDHFSLEVQGLASSGPGGFTAFLTDGNSIFYTVTSPEAGDSLGGYQSNRIDLDHTGWYQVTISGGAPPPRSSPEPYRFALTRRSTAPEVASSALSVGDSVTGEAIDYPGDWDQYTLTGSPGEQLLVLGQFTGGPVYPTLTVLDSDTGTVLAEMPLQAIPTVSDTVSIPASGQLQIAVRQPRGIGIYYCPDATCGGSLGITGPYRLVILPFNPAPEIVPASFALGDTVRGETISPAGDVDEFTSSATPGDSLVEWFRLPVATTPPFEEISMEVIDPATGAVLAGSGASMNAPTSYFVTMGAFRVPASGNYKVRVFQYNPGGGAAAATAQYEFFLAKAP